MINPYAYPGLNFLLITKERIYSEVEKEFGVSLMSPTRKRQVVDARRVYCILARRYTVLSMASIGRSISKDHSTVVHYCNNKEILWSDTELDDKYRRIKERLKYGDQIVTISHHATDRSSDDPNEHQEE